VSGEKDVARQGNQVKDFIVKKVAEDASQAHSDLRGIFATNDPAALGAHATLEKAGKTQRIIIVGFDGQPEGKQAI
jgi:ribose transport system substrate-binding protein